MPPLLARLRSSLLARVAVALAVVGLVPLVVSVSRLVPLTRREMTRQVINTHAVAARTAAEGVGEFVAGRRLLAHSLASNPTIRDPRSAAARQLLSSSLEAWGGVGILGAAVVTRAGEEVIRVQLTDDLARGRVDEALALAPGAEVEAVAGGDRLTLRLESPLPGGDGRVWLVADGAPLAPLLDAYETGDEAALVLAGESQGVLAGPLASLDGFPPEMLQQAFTRRLEGVKPEFDGLYGRDGSQFIGAYAAVPYTEWVVLSRQPIAVAHRLANDLRRQATWTVAGTLAAIGALLAIAWASLVRPMRELAAAQRRLAGAGGPTSGDEIDQLKAAFRALEQSLTDREALDEVFLGRYRILDVVGSGAMGTVFKGWDPKLQRTVALKTVRLGRKLAAKRRSELVSQLLREAVTVARFNHPNIVAVYDVEDRPEGAFVAMEFVDGVSLENLLWRVERVEPGAALSLGAAIARALAAAHGHQVLHRDVKPANILLGREGSIKVTDFGIAELLSSMDPDREVVFGTPGYLAPEALQGESYGTAADLFSLGVVLYFSVAGRRPFEGKTVKEVIRQTLFGRIVPLPRIAPSVDPEFERLVMELLTRDPGRRPSDAAEVAQRLENLAIQAGGSWSLPATLAEREQPDVETVEAQWIPTTRLPGRVTVTGEEA